MVKISSSTKKAYTLVELSIVLVIIAIFLSSGLNIFTNNIVQTKTVNTKEKLNIIYKSLAEHLMTERRLPCPALLATPKDSNSDYGKPDPTSSPCSSTTGISAGGVPTIALHLSNNMAEDDFGNKILYVVDTRLTASPFNVTGFFVNNTFGNGNITISEYNQQQTEPILLLLSYGANSCGSTKINGQPNVACNDSNDGTDQLANSNNDATFTTTSTHPKFDDVILTKTYYDFLQELNLTQTQAQAYFR